MVLRKLRIPRWTIAALASVVALGCAIAGAYFNALFAGIGALGLFTGTVLGEATARHGSQRDGDLTMAIFLGYAIGQWMPTVF
jgi:hydrogenase/urease accessory protein HupE